jgi:general secretion pathway protein H
MLLPRHASARAFTLIELMIVIAVIALLAAAAGPALGGITGADARKAAGEVAGTMRWLFDSASVRHATCRLAIDPAERTFWAECAPGRTTIERDPEKAAERAAERRAHADEGRAAALSEPAGFAAFEDPIVRKRELPGNAKFEAVRVDGRDAVVEGRIAYVHFFPGGRAQAARVTIADGGHVYSIRLEPFTGRARVFAGVPEEREP